MPAVRWTLAQPGNEDVRSVNALVGETNDGALNDIRGMPVTRDHVAAAITSAKAGPVEEGAVGAGTGTIAFGWKGGIGTSSRVGAAAGATVDRRRARADRTTAAGSRLPAFLCWKETAAPARSRDEPPAPGSDARRLLHDRRRDRRAARRARPEAARGAGDLALARTGSTYSNGSGDFAIAFSTHPSLRVTAASGPQPRTRPADRRRVEPLRSGARSHGGSRLQLDAQSDGHHRQRPNDSGAADSIR